MTHVHVQGNTMQFGIWREVQKQQVQITLHTSYKYTHTQNINYCRLYCDGQRGMYEYNYRLQMYGEYTQDIRFIYMWIDVQDDGHSVHTDVYWTDYTMQFCTECTEHTICADHAERVLMRGRWLEVAPRAVLTGGGSWRLSQSAMLSPYPSLLAAPAVLLA